MIPKFLLTKRFWIFEILATPLLSLNIILWIGRNIEAISIIVMTFFISNMIAWIISKKRIGSLCLFSWLFGGGSYVLDIVLIDLLKLSTHETYPLIIGSVLLAPLFAVINGVLCLSVWIIASKKYKRVNFQRTVATTLSCIGAIGAGICIGAGLYWWFAAFGLIAIISGWWAQRLLRSVSGSGIIWVYKSLDKKDFYQNGKPKPNIEINDYLSQLKTFIPFILIFLFVVSAVIFGCRSSKTYNGSLPDNVIEISANEAVKNGRYRQSEVYDLSKEECVDAVKLLEGKFPRFVIPNGHGYRLSDRDSTNVSIPLYEFSDYHIQLIGLIENNQKRISAICINECFPTYPNELVMYKGTPPDIISFVIDLDSKTVTL